MSIAKKRAQKSLNQSNLSELSNSENIRDSSIFKNHALLEIQNVSVHNQCKSSRKEVFEESSIKKKTVTKKQESRMKSKENQKSKQNKATINYLSVTKIVEEKNILIANQERQIQNLKFSLQRVRKELELTRVDFDRKKLEDLANLKRQQQENDENIKELEVLRIGMRQLKSKIDSLQFQKTHLAKKSHEYLHENEELTIKLTTLKQQYSSNYLPSQETINSLTHELNILKEQQKQTKELESQKATLEERCRSLERKINEYVLRYNEVQSDYNETQIKYYRAQKENDDLKMNIEELEIQNRNGKKMLEEEKKIMSQLMEKWKGRIVRLEDLHKTGGEKKYNAAIEIEERCARLEQFEIEEKMQERIVQIGNLKTKIALLSSELEILKCESARSAEDSQKLIGKLQEELSCLRSQKEELQRSYQAFKKSEQQLKVLQLSRHEQELNTLKNQLAKSNEAIDSVEKEILLLTEINKALTQRVTHLEPKLGQNEEYQKRVNELETAIEAKSSQILKLSQINKKVSQELKQVVNVVRLKGTQIEEEAQKYNQTEQRWMKSVQELAEKECRIAELEESQKSLRSEVSALQSDLYLSQLNLQTIESSLHEKLSILELNIKQLQNRNADQAQHLATKTAEITRMETIIANTNGELKEIRNVVNGYKQQIEECNEALANGDRKYENHVYLSKEAELKLGEEISYYKGKYEQSFKQSLELSNNIRELQNQLVEQVNKNTEMMKSISNLQSQAQKASENKSLLQLLVQKEVETLNGENNRLKKELKTSEDLISQMGLQIRQTQIRLASITFQNTKLKEESLRKVEQLVKFNEESITEERMKHRKEIEQLSMKFEEENKKNMELEQLRFQKYCKIHKEQQVAIAAKLEQALKEIEEKNIVIRQNHEVISQKQGQIDTLKSFKVAIEAQEVRKIKEYNFALVRQAEEASIQLNKNFQELREVTEQSQKYRSTINHLEREINALQNRNIQLGNQINNLRCTAFQQNEQHSRIITEIKCHVITCEQKIKCQAQEIALWMQKYENTDKELKKIQHECNKVSRSYLQESNRKNKENGRQIQNYRTQIKLLQEENLNLQKVMDKELGKRKIIIEELIHEKKILYEQIGH